MNSSSDLLVLINQSKIIYQHNIIIKEYSYLERIIIPSIIFITVVLFLKQLKQLFQEEINRRRKIK